MFFKILHQKDKQPKEKTDKANVIKILNFCASKAPSRNKRQLTEWEKIFANHIYIIETLI